MGISSPLNILKSNQRTGEYIISISPQMYVTEPPPPILPPPVIHHDTWSLRAKEIFADQHNLPSATATMNPNNSFTVNTVEWVWVKLKVVIYTLFIYLIILTMILHQTSPLRLMIFYE